MRRDLSGGLLVLMLCGVAVFGQESVPVSPIQAPDVTLQGPQRQQPPAQRQPANGIPRTAPRPVTTMHAPYPGTVEGFVYWNAGSISHTPVGSCSGLQVTVSVGNSSGGPGPTPEQFTPLPPLTNNFKYVGNVGSYAVCTYAFDHVPVGPNVQVKIDVTGASTFSPISAPAVAITGPIKIINGKCNNLPPAVPSPSDLTSHWWTCGNYAYNVNFVLQPSAVRVMGAPTRTGLLSGSSPSQPTLLSSTPKPGMLAAGGAPTPLAASGAPTPQASGGSPAPQAGSGQLLGNRTVSSQKPLTNTDVIKMVQAGVPEPTIISSLQSNGKNFDFSPAGCHSLNTANVSANVLTAMGDGSMPACSAAGGTGGVTAAVSGTANPSIKSPVTREQRLAILKKPSPGSRFAVSPRRTTPAKALRKVTNPRLAEQNERIIALLREQKFAADREASAMKVGTRAITSEASAPRLALAMNLGRNPVQNLAPEQTQDSQTLSSRMVHEPYFNGIVLLCAKDPTPRITYVNGGEGHGTIFTPDPKYNLYTIVGCSFGASNSGNMAYITGANGFKANLNIDSWGDNGITAHLDPWLAGVLDQDNVTLVLVSPAAGLAIQQPGFSFYAARGMPGDPNNTPQEVPLAYNSVPQADVNLSSVTDILFGWDNVPKNATSAFPSFSFQGTPVAGWVFRYAYGHDDSANFFTSTDPRNYECWINGQDAYEVWVVAGNQVIAQQYDCSTYFNPARNEWTANLWGPIGPDQWNISLAPQFAISSYELYYDPTDPSQICGAWDDSSKTSGQIGNWDFNLTGPNQITVSYPLFWCFDQEAWPFNRVNAQRQSAYGMAVWVWGPRCIDPIKGNPDTSCMATVKQRLGG